MFVILWEFEVKPGSEACFERVYGPAGPWVQLFQLDSHYRGTKLLRDVSRPEHFFTIDYWDLESAYHAFLACHKTAYDKIDRSCADLTVREQLVLSCVLDQPTAPNRENSAIRPPASPLE